MLYILLLMGSVLLWLSYYLNRKQIVNPVSIFFSVWGITLYAHILLTSWDSIYVLPVEDVTYSTIFFVIFMFSLGAITTRFIYQKYDYVLIEYPADKLEAFNCNVVSIGVMSCIGGIAGIILFVSTFGFHYGDILSIREMSIGGGIGSHPLGYVRDLLLPMGYFSVIITIVNWNVLSKRQKLYGLWLPILIVGAYTYISASRIIFVSLALVSILAWLFQPLILLKQQNSNNSFKKRIIASIILLIFMASVSGLYSGLRMAGGIDDIAYLNYTEEKLVIALEPFGLAGKISAVAISSSLIYISKPITELDIFLASTPDRIFWGAYEFSFLNLPLKLLGENVFQDARDLMFSIQYRAGRWENTWATSIRDVTIDFGYYGMFFIFYFGGIIFQYTWNKTINSQRMDFYIFLILQLYFIITSTWYSAFLLRRFEFSVFYILIVIYVLNGRIKCLKIHR